MNDLNHYQEKYLTALAGELRKFIKNTIPDSLLEMKDIFSYHLSLDKSGGKRIRPLLLLLCAEGAGGNWEHAMPAAAAIELVHNFSLIHDDIEDKGEFRRGKRAVWVKWGLEKGLNAGDAMFTASFKSLANLDKYYENEIVQDSYRIFVDTCLELTFGQHLDIDFENRSEVLAEEYYEMINYKTAALIASSSRIGALLAGKEKTQQEIYMEFGRHLGIAFQIYDDWLGVWGDPEKTGKSASSDIVEGKKSLPIILGINASDEFRSLWSDRETRRSELKQQVELLTKAGVENEVLHQCKIHTTDALAYLDKTDCTQEMKLILRELTSKLLIRRK